MFINEFLQNSSKQLLINPYHLRMFMSSFLFLLLGLIAFFRDFYIIGLVDILLFLTSVNYWNYPIKGIRRNVDITMIVLFVIVHGVYLPHFNYAHSYIILTVLIISLYFCAKLWNNHNYSSIFHTIMHIFVFGLFFCIYEEIEGY